MSSEIVKWGDEAMYEAAPIRRGEDEIRITPKVFLLSATPDPLGSLAAGFRMYGGKPTYSLDNITDDERNWAWEESLRTHLKAPWEFIDLHFFIEGVTRSFTHQMVRQRTAVYAQESLRFAVKEGMASEVAYPPSIVNNETAMAFWEKMVKEIETTYSALVNMGIPAEDARGLLPHCTTTRLNYKTNFRGLIEHAGNRLCTQAQFEWRSVFIGIVKAIRECEGYTYSAYEPGFEGDPILGHRYSSRWQFEILARPLAQTFTPVCYKAGKCVFMGQLDRGCTIRDRVQAFAAAGVPSDKWGVEGINWAEPIAPIRPEEWLANPMAGITDENNPGPQDG